MGVINFAAIATPKVTQRTACLGEQRWFMYKMRGSQGYWDSGPRLQGVRPQGAGAGWVSPGNGDYPFH